MIKRVDRQIDVVEDGLHIFVLNQLLRMDAIAFKLVEKNNVGYVHDIRLGIVHPQSTGVIRSSSSGLPSLYFSFHSLGGRAFNSWSAPFRNKMATASCVNEMYMTCARTSCAQPNFERARHA